MKRIVLLTVLLVSAACAFGRGYRPEEIPNVQQADRRRYVSNPDGVLSDAAVARIDRLCDSLRTRGVAQVAVVAVEEIAGGDSFTFAIELFGRWGVGGAKSDNGLGILLVRGLHEIRFVTGYGLEGILPDGLCKRIQTARMIPLFRQEDYDGGMLAGLSAVAEVLAGGDPDLSDSEPPLSVAKILLFVALFLGLPVALGLLSHYRSRRCPHCHKFGLRQQSVDPVATTSAYRTWDYTYICSACGATVKRRVRKSRNDGPGGGPGGGILLGGGGFGGFGGFGGGSGGGGFGGGSFGGGGAGSKW